MGKAARLRAERAATGAHTKQGHRDDLPTGMPPARERALKAAARRRWRDLLREHAGDRHAAEVQLFAEANSGNPCGSQHDVQLGPEVTKTYRATCDMKKGHPPGQHQGFAFFDNRWGRMNWVADE